MPAAQEIADHDHRRETPWLALTLGFLLLAVGYILSPAPMMWIDNAYGLPGPVEQFVQVFFYPLESAYNNNEAVRFAYDAWFSLWHVR